MHVKTVKIDVISPLRDFLTISIISSNLLGRIKKLNDPQFDFAFLKQWVLSAKHLLFYTKNKKQGSKQRKFQPGR